MSASLHDLPTFDHYAFNLRDGLRQAAVSSLSELEKSITSKGYDWLDGYMESIMNRQESVPITDYMKTPSRTHTVKKTRATTAAAQDRTDKVKGLNARLALSPVISKQSSRQPLSPLQPRSLNAIALSLTPVQSPKGTPPKPKADEAKGKPKIRKPRTKKKAKNDENSPPTSAETSMDKSSASSSTRSTASSATQEKPIEASEQTVEKEKSKSSRLRKAAKAPVQAVEEQMEVDVPELEVESPTPASASTGKAIDTQQPVETVHDQHRNEPEAAETALIPDESPIHAEEAEEPVANAPHVHDEDQAASSVEPETEPEEDMPETQVQSVVEPQQPEPEQPVVEETPVPGQQESEREHKVDPTMPTSFASIPPSTAAGPSAPVRQVRSSWLSKALGTGTVPLSGMPGSEGDQALRKSYAALAQHRQSNVVDFSGLRKSLVPAGGLKRKSEQGVEEEDDHDKRPEKTTKVTIDAPASINYDDALPARTPGPIPRPAMPAKTPSFSAVGITQPDSQGRSAPSSASQADSQRSDIHRVTRALDELREKTAAKELAKQRASQSARVPQAKSTGTGFLRGLGNLGAGFLGLGGEGVESAEDEAERKARELEEEQLAEQELERLMREATKSEAESAATEEDMQVDDREPANVEAQPTRSTTPELAPSMGRAETPKSPEEGEEMLDEHSFVDDLIPADPRTSTATTQRPRSVTSEPEAEVVSTTPTGTPTKIVKPQAEAPALHARAEKHVHEPSAARQKQQVTEEEWTRGEAREEEEEEDDDDLEEEDEEIEEIEVQKPVRGPVRGETKTHRKIPSTSSIISTQLTNAGVLGQAQNMASKALGVKPATAPVKSVLLAAAAAKKEQAALERKSHLKEADAKRAQLAKKKAEEERLRAEEERVRAEEERKAKVAEIEEKKRKRAELDKRNRERAAAAAAAQREKAEKERMEREAQAAKMRAAEEEAARQRKAAAAALTKSQNAGPAGTKRPAGLGSSQQGGTKGKEPFRPTKQNALASSTSSVQLAKMGPSSFRTAETHQATSSTITLVSQQSQAQAQAQAQAERKALGPPSRPSAMAQSNQPQPMRQSTAVPHNAHGHSSSVLQQSRVALQSALDEKNAMMQSEDIVLPDIASEYSDSDDEDRTRDFIPPTWAESPQLRAALEAQATRDPDELFGPIKPLNMEELFKVRTNKFRARTSSANWHKGDGLTKSEELEYAKRMGFKPVGSSLAQGGSSQ